MILNFSNDLEQAMSEAQSYQEWSGVAQRFDAKYQLDHWKNIDKTPLYDYNSIRIRLDRLRSHRAQKDNHGLLFALNEGIHGNMGGMGKVELYQKARFGTKRLITEYIEEVVSALHYLASDEVKDISLEEKMDFFHRASHCYGRSALLLSGSGTLLYFHLGAVKALWEQDLLPNIISGSSGGALVAALVGTHTNDELEKIFDPAYLEMEAEKDAALLKSFSLFKRKQIPAIEMHRVMQRLIPEITFQEALELTGININISVAPAELHQTSRLLNAITSPNVLVREAVQASCAVPGLYPSVALQAKNIKGERQAYLPSRRWVDGSLTEDLPVKRLSRLYGVNHTIVSQTNPLVLPFINENKATKGPGRIVKNATLSTAREWALAGAKLIQRPALKSPRFNRLLNGYISVLSQPYTGDINILPPRRFTNIMKILSLRSIEEIIELVTDGEKSTWPRIEQIRIQCRISGVLDDLLESFEHDVIEQATRQSQSSNGSVSSK